MKKTLKILGFLLIVLLAIPFILPSVLGKVMGEDAKNIVQGLFKQRVGIELDNEVESTDLYKPTNQEISLDENIIPFKNIGESLGDEAKDNHAILFRGMAILDANNDGKMDMYFCHTGRPLSKKNDKNGVLQANTPMDAKPNVLYMNMGNDANGEPIFKTVPKLIKEGRNKQYVKEELLIENKYKPRNSVDDDPYGVGRIAFGAQAADFNGDGLVDLLVLNHHYGMPFTDKDLGVRVYPTKANIGREKKDLKYVVTSLPPYYKSDMQDGMHNTVNFGDESEGEGRNTLFINMGDKDNDGLPEWKDMTKETGMHTTNWASASATVADFDRDGDLDVYISNFVDPDFWGFGIDQFGGHPNEFWVNQLVETGEFKFIEKAKEFKIAGLHDEENLPSSMYDHKKKELFECSEHIYKGKQVGMKADHSWVAQFVDFNDDTYPDLIVANDEGNRLRVYENDRGNGFKVMEKFHHARWNGSWMGIASGDLDGDQQDEIMLANFGTQSLSIRNTAIIAKNEDDLSIIAMSVNNYIEDQAVMHHGFLTYNSAEGLVDKIKDTHIEHCPYITPDMVNKANWAPSALHLYDKFNFKESFASLGFSWNPSFFDIENDGDLDIYIVGGLSRGNDNFLGEFASNSGRLLINNSEPGNYRFTDRTLEYQALDISHMDYSSNPPSRPSPGTNWHKRDRISIMDVDGFAENGYDASKNSKIKDIFRMHEAAHSNVVADLNNDGFNDVVVLHGGGNNSNSPDARNLKVNFLGKTLAIPPPNKVIKAPTTFEEGPTFLYLNKGAPKNNEGANWVKLDLRDNLTKNRYGVGAKVIVNGKTVRKHNVGGESYSGKMVPIHLGLGSSKLEKLEIFWGSGDPNPQLVLFKDGVTNQTLTIERTASEEVATK